MKKIPRLLWLGISALLVVLAVLGIRSFRKSSSEIEFMQESKDTNADSGNTNSARSSSMDDSRSQNTSASKGEPQKAQAQNIEEYKKYLEQVMEKLPKVDDIKKLSSEELHHTPQILLDSAGDFVKILETAEISAVHRVESQKFFSECTQASAVATSLRATCLSNLVELHVTGGGKKEDFDYSPYPKTISRLVEGF